MTEHRIELVQFGDPPPERVDRDSRGLGHLRNVVLALGQEFVQRRIEQADGDGEPRHDPEDLGEIAALGGEQVG